MASIIDVWPLNLHHLIIIIMERTLSHDGWSNSLTNTTDDATNKFDSPTRDPKWNPLSVRRPAHYFCGAKMGFERGARAGLESG